MKKVVLIIAEKNFRDEEYQQPKTIMENAGIKVFTASTTTHEVVGKLGLKVKPDILISEIIINQFDGIFFIGGGGAEQYFNDLVAHNLLLSAKNENKIYGAICIAPVILANAGLLKNKKATVFESEIEYIKDKGAIYNSSPVVTDGNLITANGPMAAKKFGEEIITLIGN
jgi:protease I